MNTAIAQARPARMENLHQMQASDLVDWCLGKALLYRASDVHFQPNGEYLEVRVRVDGQMRTLVQMPMEAEARMINFIKTKASMDVNERRVPSDGRFTHIFEGNSFDMRVNCTPVYEKVNKDNQLCRQRLTIRILDNRSIEAPLPALGFVPDCREMLDKALEKRQGLILCTGPTGSGKTTLLYVMVKRIANERINILGVGDPPEYEVPEVNQAAVSENCGFASFVRGFLRQDPDVIMVGEIRDEETADVVTNAAILGRLVLSSLHTNNAALAPYRLSRLGIDKSLIAEGLSLVINQRLVPKLCPECRQRQDCATPRWIELSEAQRAAVAVGANYATCDHIIEAYVPDGTRNGEPCEKCQGKGFLGRIGVFEVLDTSKLADVIREDLDPGRLYEAAIQRDAVWPMAVDALAKVFTGMITLDDARAICLR